MTKAFEAALTKFVDGMDSQHAFVNEAGRAQRAPDAAGGLPAGLRRRRWRLARCTCGGGRGRGLLHKSSVIRDDVVDGDVTRNGLPSFHAAHGVPSSIAVSDLLWTFGLAQITKGAPGSRADGCLRAAIEVLQEMAAGQFEDVAPSPAPPQPAGPARDRGAEDRQPGGSGLQDRGRCWRRHVAQEDRRAHGLRAQRGTAFQVLNDVRNLNGTEVARSAASDLRKGRDNVLTAYTWEAGAPRGLRGAGDLSDTEVEQARKDLISAGALEFGDRLAARLLDEACGSLDALVPSLGVGDTRGADAGVLRDHAF